MLPVDVFNLLDTIVDGEVEPDALVSVKCTARTGVQATKIGDLRQGLRLGEVVIVSYMVAGNRPRDATLRHGRTERGGSWAGRAARKGGRRLAC